MLDVGGLGFEFCVFVAGWRQVASMLFGVSGLLWLLHSVDCPSTAELLARTSQASMADHIRRHRVRWLGHAVKTKLKKKKNLKT